jgi:hypothetical protein
MQKQDTVAKSHREKRRNYNKLFVKANLEINYLKVRF